MCYTVIKLVAYTFAATKAMAIFRVVLAFALLYYVVESDARLAKGKFDRQPLHDAVRTDGMVGAASLRRLSARKNAIYEALQVGDPCTGAYVRI